MSLGPEARTRHEHAIELLDRALAYTRGALLGVRDEHLHRPTPCERWDVDALLHHMDDALDAFLEGAAGEVGLHAAHPGTVDARIGLLQTKACALLGAWSRPPRHVTVAIGDAALPATQLALAAALEITVHGWDVARATGAGAAIPAGLAASLLPVARALVGPRDRGLAFAAPVPITAGQDNSEQLLQFLGRESAAPCGLAAGQHRAEPSRQ